MLRSFFDYPDESELSKPQDLIFLPQWDGSKWATLLKYAETRSFHAGDQVIRLGDRDRSLYIIIEGQLEILIPHGNSGRLRRTQIGEAGAVIGEQAFIDGKPRSATIQALTDGQMLRLSIDAFEVLAAHHPELAREILFDLARMLSIKLRQTNEFISNWIK